MSNEHLFTEAEREMMKTGQILFYIREEPFGWLSNFARYEQKIDGVVYPANEYYYQRKKACDPQIQKWIDSAPSAYMAMIVGRGLREKEMVPGWDKIKNAVMYNGLRAKFLQNPPLREKLLATGDLPIHENSPHDRYWGMKGEDVLGQLLMNLRSEIPCDICTQQIADQARQKYYAGKVFVPEIGRHLPHGAIIDSNGVIQTVLTRDMVRRIYEDTDREE